MIEIEKESSLKMFSDEMQGKKSELRNKYICSKCGKEMKKIDYLSNSYYIILRCKNIFCRRKKCIQTVEGYLRSYGL